jgi:hypothetical protein
LARFELFASLPEPVVNGAWSIQNDSRLLVDRRRDI